VVVKRHVPMEPRVTARSPALLLCLVPGPTALLLRLVPGPTALFARIEASVPVQLSCPVNRVDAIVPRAVVAPVIAPFVVGQGRGRNARHHCRQADRSDRSPRIQPTVYTDHGRHPPFLSLCPLDAPRFDLFPVGLS
jgi:hypothetical protein